MNAWVETGCVIALSGCGFYLASLLSRLPKQLWLAVWFVSLAVVLLFGIQRYTHGLEFVPLFSWVAATRTRLFLFPVIIPALLLVPAGKLPGQRGKALFSILSGMVILQFSVLPALLPAFNHSLLLGLKTKYDRDDVCLQSTGYTCGPAAAVTALNRLGVPAQEGEIAVWARTTATAGTPPDSLTETLQEHFGAQGVTAQLKYFKTVSELRQAGLTVAVTKFDFLTDHYVTILKATDTEVVVGDPLNGRVTYSYDDFAKIWRYTGIVIQRAAGHP